MSSYSAFFFVESSTARTHLLAWDPHIREWLIPCGMIERPHRDRVTYSPTRPLCRVCERLTQQVFERDPRPTRADG